MNGFEFSLSLRIEHPGMSPQDISTALSLTPRTSWCAGDPRRSPEGRVLDGRYPTTYWSCNLDHPPGESLSECLGRSAETLAPHAEFLRTIRSTGGRCEFFVGWFSGRNSGELLGCHLLCKLCELQIDLALDVYGS